MNNKTRGDLEAMPYESLIEHAENLGLISDNDEDDLPDFGELVDLILGQREIKTRLIIWVSESEFHTQPFPIPADLRPEDSDVVVVAVLSSRGPKTIDAYLAEELEIEPGPAGSFSQMVRVTSYAKVPVPAHWPLMDHTAPAVDNTISDMEQALDYSTFTRVPRV